MDDAAPAVEQVAPAEPGEDAERFRRRRRVGNVGLGIAGGSLALTGIGVGLLATVDEGAALAAVEAPTLLGGAAVVTGVLGVTAGQVILLTGAVGSAKAAGASPALGWVGVGLSIAAIPAAGLSETDPLLGQVAPLVLGGAGFACGAAQLAIATGHARERGLVWHLAPSPRGVAIAAAF